MNFSQFVDPLLVTLVVTLIGALGWLFRLEGRVNKNSENGEDLRSITDDLYLKIEKVNDAILAHRTDDVKHVNPAANAAFSARLEKLEHTTETGFVAVADKIDQKFDSLNAKFDSLQQQYYTNNARKPSSRTRNED